MLFGLIFGAPGLLWGMALSSLPIVIHLLNRQRFKEMAWAAMPWLLAAIKKNRRRLRFEQWLLLALRTLILLLVALAMAKPTLKSAGLTHLLASSNVHHLIVFDNSLSMQYQVAGQSYWSRAKMFAQKILDQAQRGDHVSLILMQDPPVIRVGEPSPYLEEIIREIDAIKPFHGSGRIEPVIDVIAPLIEQSKYTDRRVYFLTDLQKTGWLEGRNEDADRSLGKKLAALTGKAEFVLLDVSGAVSPNRSITAAEQIEPVAVIGQPVTFEATVQNFSTLPQESVQVQLTLDGQVESSQTITLGPREAKLVRFSQVFKSAGDQVVELRLPADDLTIDNHRWLPTVVRERLSVLLIDGQPTGEPFANETDYLKVALTPGEDDVTSRIAAVVKPESAIVEENLDRFDLVVLCNIHQFTTSEASILKEYAQRGGGLLIFLGSQVQAANYNDRLFADGAGVLPLELETIIQAKTVELIDKPDAAPIGDQGAGFDPLDYQHPVTKPFRDAQRAGLLGVKTKTYWRGRLTSAGSLETVLNYVTGDPAIVLQRVGAGRSAVVTTSANLTWNTWALSPSYVPIMHELIQHLAAGRVRRDAIDVGGAIAVPTAARTTSVSAQVVTPAGMEESATLTLDPVSNIAIARHEGTDQAGVYQVKLGPPVDQSYAVAAHPPAAESDLTKLVADELKSAFPGWPFQLLTDWTKPGDVTKSVISKAEIHRPILHLVLAFLLLESFLAWRFGNRRW